jgi:tetratricopeptide (TPR) repeat protein
VEACQSVLTSRDARGSSWAEALLISARCAEKTNDPKKAAAYYQRIYVLYRAYPEILAKAYLGGGRCFEKLNMPSAAIKTYEEMVARAELKDLPEMAEVRQRLAKLGGPR